MTSGLPSLRRPLCRCPSLSWLYGCAGAVLPCQRGCPECPLTIFNVVCNCGLARSCGELLSVPFRAEGLGYAWRQCSGGLGAVCNIGQSYSGMKIRPDIVQVYRDIHSWVGILCGLFLFVAFYAGSITMFEKPLQNWLTPASSLPPPVKIENTPELLQKALAEYPEAGRHYILVVNPDRAQPARLMWPQDPTHRGHGPQDFVLAALSPDGQLVTAARRPSEIPFFIDLLHEQVGLPLPHTMARYFMGCVALAYFLALVSGIIAFLPALKKMLLLSV